MRSIESGFQVAKIEAILTPNSFTPLTSLITRKAAPPVISGKAASMILLIPPIHHLPHHIKVRPH
jgi:hypothetical protein